MKDKLKSLKQTASKALAEAKSTRETASYLAKKAAGSAAVKAAIAGAWIAKKSSTAAASVAESADQGAKWMKEVGVDFQQYLKSEQFEKDLDELAGRLAVSSPEYQSAHEEDRRARIKYKLVFIAKLAASNIGGAALKGEKIALMTKNPFVMVGAPLGLGSAKSLEIAYHCYQAFVARAKTSSRPTT